MAKDNVTKIATHGKVRNGDMSVERQREVAYILSEACHVQRALHDLSRNRHLIGVSTLSISVEHLSIRAAQMIDDAIAALGGDVQCDDLYAVGRTKDDTRTDDPTAARFSIESDDLAYAGGLICEIEKLGKAAQSETLCAKAREVANILDGARSIPG